VGQLESNVYKVRRVLEKTGYADVINEKKIEELSAGNSSAILKIIHHLLFRASERFTEFLNKSVHPDVKFMPDETFFKNISLILCDLFNYRVDMTSKQFFGPGFAEKKLIMILDLYDILKNCRKGLKINSKLVRVEPGAPHASDESRKEY
jgi:hypothetical protein